MSVESMLRTYVRRDLEKLGYDLAGLVGDYLRSRDWRDAKGHRGFSVLVWEQGEREARDRRIHAFRYGEGGDLSKYEMFEFEKFAEGVSDESLDGLFGTFIERVEKRVLFSDDWHLSGVKGL